MEFRCKKKSRSGTLFIDNQGNGGPNKGVSRGREQEEEILICDTYKKGYHYWCLTPRRGGVPEGGWDAQNIRKSDFYKNDMQSLLR